MSPRLLLVLAVFISLVVVAPAQAAPGALNILVTANDSSAADALAQAIADEPGVASASSFATNNDTPTAASLVEFDLIVSVGDSNYDDPALWGDRLADYIDAGGAVLQTAYDNWDSNGAAPTGRFESGGYAPLLRGPNENATVTLGTLVDPSHPLVQGLDTIPTTDNTTTALAPGATLLAKWSDDRNAIALKGRVAAISASGGQLSSRPGIVRLARNAGNFFTPFPVTHTLSVTKSGTGLGTVSSTPAAILCGATCSSSYLDGSKPALTATPAPDSEFKGWTGACSGLGTCEPMIAGDLGVGAVFDLAGFGVKTNLTLSATSTKIAKNAQLKIRLRNANNFSITGTVSGRTSGKVQTSSLKIVTIKSKKAPVKALGSKTVVLKLPKSLQNILKEKGKLKLRITAKIKSPSGTSRTVTKKLTVKPKR